MKCETERQCSPTAISSATRRQALSPGQRRARNRSPVGGGPVLRLAVDTGPEGGRAASSAGQPAAGPAAPSLPRAKSSVGARAGKGPWRGGLPHRPGALSPECGCERAPLRGALSARPQLAGGPPAGLARSTARAPGLRASRSGQSAGAHPDRAGGKKKRASRTPLWSGWTKAASGSSLPGAVPGHPAGRRRSTVVGHATTAWRSWARLPVRHSVNAWGGPFACILSMCAPRTQWPFCASSTRPSGARSAWCAIAGVCPARLCASSWPNGRRGWGLSPGCPPAPPSAIRLNQCGIRPSTATWPITCRRAWRIYMRRWACRWPASDCARRPRARSSTVLSKRMKSHY
jgi:hypothetical protein